MMSGIVQDKATTDTPDQRPKSHEPKTGLGNIKLFVTGCPRSGTTLLQSILAGSAGLYTLKETHFFKHLTRRRPLRWIDRHIQLDPARVRASFEFIAMNNGIDIPDDLSNIRRLDQACALLDRMLGQAAKDNGFSGWLEKTPEHMFFIDDIRHHVPGAQFVHIVRDGSDVVASLVDAKRKYPESWGWIGNLSSTVGLYNRYARAMRAEIGKPDSFILRYQDIVGRDHASLKKLSAFLKIPASTIDLDETTTFRPDVVRQDEPWKVRNDHGIVNTSGEKFRTLFTDQERHFINQKLISTADILSG